METCKRTFPCPNSNPETYFNFGEDILYISYDNFSHTRLDVWNGFREQDTGDLGKVERLAIRLCAWSFDEEDIRKVLSIFPQVKKLYLVVYQHDAKDLTTEDQADLCMIDPIDVQETIRMFQTFDFRASLREIA